MKNHKIGLNKTVMRIIWGKYTSTMKTLLCSLLLAFWTYSSIYAQKNTLYLSYQIQDNGFGVRYDRQFNNDGLYASASYGNYKFPQGYIKDHLKLSVGGISYRESAFLSFGIAYNHYGERLSTEDMDSRVFQPFTVELGAGTSLGRVNVAFRMDLVVWVSSVCVGYKF